MAAHGDDIARLLRGEVEPLSTQERDEVLRHRLSYLATDLVVPSWNGAFVYDTEAGLPGALEILEFANSQLLQFRYYDQRLDRELAQIYARLQTTRWYEPWIGRRYTAAARELHSVLIDVNELTDRTENALKLVGDVYGARLLGLAAARLGLSPGRTRCATSSRRSTTSTASRSIRRRWTAARCSRRRSCSSWCSSSCCSSWAS